MSDTYIKNPADFLKVGQKVKVWVVEVDMARKRIGLTMRKNSNAESRSIKREIKSKEPPAPIRKQLYSS